MRSREEILDEWDNDGMANSSNQQVLEVLLDIRDLLSSKQDKTNVEDKNDTN